MRWNKPLATVLLWAPAVLASAQASPELGLGLPWFTRRSTSWAPSSRLSLMAVRRSRCQSVDLALQEVVRLDDVMSDYKADSALSRLNHSSHSRPQRVPPDLYRVIGEALQYSRLSGGTDVTVGPLVNLWKAAIRGGHPPSSADEEKVRACVGYQKVESLPPTGSSSTRPVPGLTWAPSAKAMPWTRRPPYCVRTVYRAPCLMPGEARCSRWVLLRDRPAGPCI